MLKALASKTLPCSHELFSALRAFPGSTWTRHVHTKAICHTCHSTNYGLSDLLCHVLKRFAWLIIQMGSRKRSPRGWAGGRKSEDATPQDNTLPTKAVLLFSTTRQHPNRACLITPSERKTGLWVYSGVTLETSCDSSVQFSSVQSLSCVRLFATPWIAAHQASLSITNSRSLLKLMSIESVMPSSHPILCCPLLLLPPIPPSIRIFSNESTLHIRWPKYWSFSFSISPSNEHPGLISFRMDWLDLLGVQGTLKSLLQHHSSKASIFWCSAFFTV